MKRTIKIVGFILLVWLFLPTSQLVAPDWDVVVTDISGKPLDRVKITVASQQYTLESRDVEESATTDANGRVRLHQRKLHTIRLLLFLGAIRNILSQGAEASFGVHTYLMSSKPGYGEPSNLTLFSQNEREGRPNGSTHQFSHISLQKCSSGYSGLGCSFPDDPSKPPLPLNLK